MFDLAVRDPGCNLGAFQPEESSSFKKRKVYYNSAKLRYGAIIMQWNMFHPWVYCKPFEAQINPLISWMQCCLILKYPVG